MPRSKLQKKPSSIIWDKPDEDDQGGWLNCGRYALVVSNLLFFILGAFMVCFGIWFTFIPANQNIITIAASGTTQSYMKISMYLIQATGGFTIILAIIGCCAAISNTKYILGTFFLFLVVLFVQLATVASLSVWLRIRIDGDISYQMRKTLMEAYFDDEADNKESVAWREVQKAMKCCGFTAKRGYRDYRNKSDEYPEGSLWWQLQQGYEMRDENTTKRIWPDSCCKTKVVTESDAKKCHEPGNMHKKVFMQGCKDKLQGFLNQNLLVVTVMAIMLSVIEVVHFATVRKLEAELEGAAERSTASMVIFDSANQQLICVPPSCSTSGTSLMEEAKSK